jgi:hypothetical protein
MALVARRVPSTVSGSVAVGTRASRTPRNRENNHSKPRTVSATIPSFNDCEFLPEAIASVTNLGREDIEIIVVDDGSTDERTRGVMDVIPSAATSTIREVDLPESAQIAEVLAEAEIQQRHCNPCESGWRACPPLA